MPVGDPPVIHEHAGRHDLEAQVAPRRG
jgi:hypothetical protein